MAITLDVLMDLVEKICVILVIAYLITRTKYFHEILERKFTYKNMLFLIIIFGLLSIYGTYSGITINGSMGNVRDLGPIIAGLVGGPIAGLGAGLIGGLYRYFFLGGITTLPCSLATILAGLFAGMVYIFNKRRFIGIIGAVTFTVFMESLHIGLVLLLAKPYPQALIIAQTLSLPIILSNAIGILIFSYFITNLTKEMKTTRERDEYFEEIQRKKYELEIAHEIQDSFLPDKMPQIDGFDLAAISMPAKEVGGDFYDFIPISKDKIGITIADVSGKSIPAALFMAVSRSFLRAKAVGNPNATEVIKDVNTLIIDDSKSGMFVTLFYAILDFRNNIMEYVNAGHNPPVMLVRETGRMECLSSNGIALGALDSVEFEEKQINLKSGDVIVFYTDGVTEAVNNNGELFGEKRLYKLIKSDSDLSSQELVNKIKNALISFSENQSQFDDITLMIIKVE